MDISESIKQAFITRYGEGPSVIVRAPGRVNLIGEHTDYNDGFVLPMAIDRAMWIALRPRVDQQVNIYSLDYEDLFSFNLNALNRGENSPVEYMKGVAWALAEAGYILRGWDGVMKGDVPIGAGLSSSAALELATARAFAAISPIEWHPATMAKLGQKAENLWVGVNCGIMDQMISAAGRAGHALLIDCRSLETELAPLPTGATVIILDTATRRGLVDSAYNERRAQCEAAARFFGVSALRDVDSITFAARAHELDELTQKRARHVITENERTLKARDAMKANDAIELGQLMNASHDSLRDDFEVSSDALNSIVRIAQTVSGCYGARMTGAGFGGCAVALVETTKAIDFAQIVSQRYTEATGLVPQIYICQATDGASIIT